MGHFAAYPLLFCSPKFATLESFFTCFTKLIFGKFGRPQIYGRKWPIGCKLPYGNRLINYSIRSSFVHLKSQEGQKSGQG